MNVLNLPYAWAYRKRALVVVHFFLLLFCSLKKTVFIYGILSRYLSWVWVSGSRKHEAKCICVSLSEQWKQQRVRSENALTEFCKSTFHHFYNAYIRLWVFRFFMRFCFACSLRISHMERWMCLFSHSLKDEKMFPMNRLFVPFNAFKAVRCANRIVFVLFLFMHLKAENPKTYDSFMIHSQRENMRNKMLKMKIIVENNKPGR